MQSGKTLAKCETMSPTASPVYYICQPRRVGEAMGEIAIRYAKIGDSLRFGQEGVVR
jgi:hypothetical protein